MNNQKKKIHNLVKIGVLGGLATVLMLFQTPLPFAPPFYQMDLSELPVIIGGLAMGPVAGVLIELIKVLLNFVINGTITMGVGEMSNFIIGCAFVVPASVIYKKSHSKKGAACGLIVGVGVMTVIGAISNAFVVLPAYSYFMHIDMSVLINMGTKVNPMIDGVWAFILFAVVPFNLLKGVLITALTLLIYKKVRVILR